jgi:hypothetical protein
MVRDRHFNLDGGPPHAPASDREHLRRGEPAQTVGRTRALPAIAATLLVVALAGAIFGLLGGSRRPQHGVAPTPRPSGCNPTTISASFPAHFLSINRVMVSPEDAWLLGPNSVVYHYSRCAWRQVPVAFPGFNLTDIVMTSPVDGWISGTDDTGTQAIVLHLVGGNWVRVPNLGNSAADSAQGRYAMETGKQPRVIVTGNKVQGHGNFTSTLFSLHRWQMDARADAAAAGELRHLAWP